MIIGSHREAKSRIILAEKWHWTFGVLHRAAIGFDAIEEGANWTNCRDRC
jgi:hypothetical protein